MSAAAPTVVGYDPILNKAYRSTGLGRPIVDYLARKTNQGRSARTLDDKERYLSSLALTYPDRELGDLSSSDVDHWLSLQPVRSRRVRGSHVNDFLEWALRWDLIDRNPMDRLDPIQRPKQKTYDIFLEAEVEALCALPLPDGPLMRCLFDTGLRKGDARRLQARHLIPEPAPGQLRILGGKGDKDRLVPLTLRLSSALHSLMLTEGMGPKDFFWYVKPGGHHLRRDSEPGDTSMQLWWERCLRDAGVRYRNMHLARHTFATTYLRKGARLETLRDVLGHESIQTTADLYSHLDVRDVAMDIALLEA